MPWNTNTFEISKGSSRVVFQTVTGPYLKVHPPYYVFNIGKSQLEGSLLRGNAVYWFGSVASNMVEPGKAITLEHTNEKSEITGMKIINHSSDITGYVHVMRSTGYDDNQGTSYSINLNANDVIKAIVATGATKIPFVGDALSLIIGFYWPTSTTSVWDQIKDQVIELVDEKTQGVIMGILGGAIRSVQKRIELFEKDVQDGHTSIVVHYLNIAQDLIGEEQKFVIEQKDNQDYVRLNYLLLPMYSLMINLKMAFYKYGIVNHEKLGLDPSKHLDSIKRYMDDLINNETTGAISHINKVYKEKLEEEYHLMYAEQIYDYLATVRRICSLTGFEFYAVWRHMISDPLSTDKPHNPAITYSNMYGRPTPELFRVMILDDGDIPKPLTPPMEGTKLKKILRLKVWIWKKSESSNPKIAGITVIYDGPEEFTTGTTTDESRDVLFFDNRHIIKLTVWGTGRIDCLEFHMDGTNNYKIGTEGGEQHEFELENHHIVGFVIKNDHLSLGGQAANIAVTYQIIPPAETPDRSGQIEYRPGGGGGGGDGSGGGGGGGGGGRGGPQSSYRS